MERMRLSRILLDATLREPCAIGCSVLCEAGDIQDINETMHGISTAFAAGGAGTEGGVMIPSPFQKCGHHQSCDVVRLYLVNQDGKKGIMKTQGSSQLKQQGNNLAG